MDVNKEKQWFSDEWFWENFGPIMFDDKRLAATPQEVESIISLTDLTDTATVLDCCCGMGRHAINFAKKGFKTTGLDLSKHYLKIAKDAASEEDVTIDWLLQDARDINFDSQFDLITNMFTSFGYFEDAEDDLVLLEKLHRSLKPGGHLFMELSGKEVLARDFEERTWFERELNGEIIKILLEYSVDLNWTELHNRWLFTQQNQIKEYNFSHRIFSAQELSQLCAEAGFQMINVYGGFNGEPYDHNASHLIIDAIKS